MQIPCCSQAPEFQFTQGQIIVKNQAVSRELSVSDLASSTFSIESAESEPIQVNPIRFMLQIHLHLLCPSRSHSPVTDLSFDPAFPDNDVHVASVGMGFLCHAGGKFLGLIACADAEKSFLAKSAIGLDVFYQALIFDARTVTGSPNPTVNGTYHSTNHAGGATFRLNF